MLLPMTLSNIHTLDDLISEPQVDILIIKSNSYIIYVYRKTASHSLHYKVGISNVPSQKPLSLEMDHTNSPFVEDKE